MRSPDWNSFTRETDWTKIFNWTLFGTMLLCVLPADLYMRVVTAQTNSVFTWVLLLPLPAYLFYFVTKHRLTIFILALLNAGCFLFTLGYYYTALLTPLIQNLSGYGIFFTTLFLCLTLYGGAFHAVMIKRFWGN